MTTFTKIERKTRPVDKAEIPGAFIVQLKDKQIPGVYHWLCQCYTMEDAVKIADLIKSEDEQQQVFIEVAYEVK